LDEASLIHRLQGGDLASLDALYARYAEPAVRIAYAITRSQTGAEDAVQEAFVEVIRGARRLRDPAAFRGWFYKIVVNKAKRLSRRGWLHWLPLDLTRHDKADPAAPMPEEAIVSADERAQVARSLQELPEMYRVVLVLRYGLDLTEDEMAAVLDIPPGTVKSRLHHARRRLEQRLIAPRPPLPGRQSTFKGVNRHA
jgi:RNA polymerase sigma-70 factor (ECF subfamily)